MTEKRCMDCHRAVAQRNTTGRCLSCAVKWAVATKPELREARRRAGVASAKRPGERERRSAAAKDQGLYLIGHAARDEASFRKLGQSVSSARMAWCPHEMRDDARYLTTIKRIPLAEVKQIILTQHARDMAHFVRGLSWS